MHSQKTKQPYIRSGRKNRTRKKSAVEEDPRKSLRRIRKMSPRLWIAEINGITEDRKALEKTGGGGGGAGGGERKKKNEKKNENPPPPKPPPKHEKKQQRKKELSISKHSWKLPRRKPLKTGGPKNKPELKKLTSEWIRALQIAQKTAPEETSWVGDGSGKQREKVTLRREKRGLQ